MYQAYKFRMYPTNEQQIALAKSFGCCRWFWNYSLTCVKKRIKFLGKAYLEVQFKVCCLRSKKNILGSLMLTHNACSMLH